MGAVERAHRHHRLLELDAVDSDSFDTKLQMDKDGTWFYVHVPAELRTKYKAWEHRGIIHVTTTIGSTSWDGSMLPWADGSAQISVNKAVRTKEGLALGDTVHVSVVPRD